MRLWWRQRHEIFLKSSFILYSFDLMVKEPEPSAGHGDVVLVAGRDDVRIAQGAAGLDDVLDAAGVGAIDVVAERDIRVRAESDAAQRRQPHVFAFGRYAHRHV